MQHSIAAIASVLIFSSCSNQSEKNLAIFRSTEESLVRSNKIISLNIESIRGKFSERQKDYKHIAVVKIWEIKADKVSDLCRPVEELIGDL